MDCSTGPKINWNSLIEAYGPNGTPVVGFEHFWPPQLSVLVAETSTFKPGFLSVLPQTLQSLELSVPMTAVQDYTPQNMETFPPLLTHFKLTVKSDGYAFSFDAALPSTLTELEVVYTGAQDIANPVSIATLPASLKSLNFSVPSRSDLPHACYWNFPNHLVRIQLVIWHHDWNAHLPKTLQEMHVQNLIGFKNTPAGDLIHLPPGLTNLSVLPMNMNLGPAESLPNDSFICLPNLTQLTFLAGRFSSDVIPKLPRGLKSVNIKITHLSLADAPFIPPLLTSVKFGSKFEWNLELAEFWPLFDTENKFPADFERALLERRKALYH